MKFKKEKKSISDRFNPILVRELRQMVRNRTVVAAINFYLFLMVAVMGYAMLLFVDPTVSKSEQFGAGLFGAITSITSVVTALVVVSQSALRVATDRINEDLLFFSTIPPGRNVWGRLVCGFVISLLFFSMSLPFWTICYLLRGIDIWMYFVFIPLPFLAIQIVNLVGVAVFSAVRSWLQLICYGILFFTIAIIICYLGVVTGGGLCLDILDLFGITSPVFSLLPRMRLPFGELVFLSIIFLSGVIFIIVTVYLFARCNLSPYSTNRMRPIRLWFSLTFLLTFLLMLFGMKFDSLFGGSIKPHYLAIWMFYVVGVLAFMLIMAVCERESWEGRLRRKIPQSRWRRALVFPFYTGSINGLFWVFLWTVLLIATVSASALSINSSTGMLRGEDSFMGGFVALMILMYVFDSSMTAFFLWKALLCRWMPREMIWTVSLALFFGIYLTAVILLEPVLRVDSILIGFILVGCVISWFLSIVAFGYPWLRNRFLDFTPIFDPSQYPIEVIDFSPIQKESNEPTKE